MSQFPEPVVMRHAARFDGRTYEVLEKGGDEVCSDCATNDQVDWGTSADEIEIVMWRTNATVRRLFATSLSARLRWLRPWQRRFFTPSLSAAKVVLPSRGMADRCRTLLFSVGAGTGAGRGFSLYGIRGAQVRVVAKTSFDYPSTSLARH